ncbi:MAG: glycogen-binding domain-containing protein [Candidatus Omnitrophica bacterium]|nr:glycogen-binding domain-containing protein [Candidatus Omnitrophota bacterium]MDD5238703.1 glycogen-binding domain-containing protein [Candidatus Omnitrophota bacterium]
MARIAAAKTAEFKLYAPQAKRVSLAGSFNNWNTRTLSAKKDSSGNWTVKAKLTPGRHEYKFIVDGSWMNDPRCNSHVGNSFGSQNSVIEIK